MSYKINDTVVVDDSRNVCACCVTSCCFTASDQMIIPSGNTAGRPTGATGSLYFDTDEAALVAYDGTEWATQGGGGVTGNVAGNCTTTLGGNLFELECGKPLQYNNALFDMTEVRVSSQDTRAMAIPKATGRHISLVACGVDCQSGTCFRYEDSNSYLSPDLNFFGISILGGAPVCREQVYGFGLERYYYLHTCCRSPNQDVFMSCVGEKIIAGVCNDCHLGIYCATTGAFLCGMCIHGSGGTRKIKGFYEPGTSGKIGVALYNSSTGKCKIELWELNLSTYCFDCARTYGASSVSQCCGYNENRSTKIAQTTDAVGFGHCNKYGVWYNKSTHCFYVFQFDVHKTCDVQENTPMPVNVGDDLYFKNFGCCTGCFGTFMYKVCTNGGICCRQNFFSRCHNEATVNHYNILPRFSADTVSFPFHRKCYSKGIYHSWATVTMPGGVSRTGDLTTSPSGYCFTSYGSSCSATATTLNTCDITSEVCSTGFTGRFRSSGLSVYCYVCG